MSRKGAFIPVILVGWGAYSKEARGVGGGVCVLGGGGGAYPRKGFNPRNMVHAFSFYEHHAYKHHQAEIWLRFFANF